MEEHHWLVDDLGICSLRLAVVERGKRLYVSCLELRILLSLGVGGRVTCAGLRRVTWLDTRGASLELIGADTLDMPWRLLRCVALGLHA